MALDTSKSLGAAIRLARKARGLTLRGLATDVGVSASLLSLLEQDAHVPPNELIVRIAGHLDGDPDLWCGLAGKITPDTEQRLARIAKGDPKFFRTMIERLGGGR